jgi:hypothetical protein
LDDIAHASRIHAVLLRGRVFDRLALDELLAKAQRAAGEAATEDEKPVDMDDLPGEIVHRGTYKSKFMTFDAGTESFAISKSADGWHMKVDSHPLGGGVRPAVVTTSTGTDFTFRRATWTTKGGAPLTATYERDGDKLRARSVQGEEREEQFVDAPEPAVVTSQAFASDFFTYRRLALEPGSKKTVTAANFGVAGWKLEVSEATYERLPDDAFTYRGAEVNAEVYTASFTTPMGTMRQKTWVGPDGLVLKTTMATPMGSLQTVLQ